MQSKKGLLTTVKKSHGYHRRWVLALLGLFVLASIGFVRLGEPEYRIKPKVDRIWSNLETLEEIASTHRGSRSVVNGHKASVQFVVNELIKYNETWTVYTQDVPVVVQVNEQPPFLALKYHGGQNKSFVPRLEVAVARGSGSSRVQDASVVFVDRCSISSGQDNDWVAVIDASKPNTETCNYCDKMAAAIREGAAGVIFIHRPGSTQGYPQGLPPSPGRCGRISKYQESMKKVGVVTLGDDAAFEFLTLFAASPKSSKIDLEVVSAFREYITLNVLADSVLGDKDQVALFGSHLDGVPAGPGINDDGSGAMTTLELARAFAESGIKPRNKIRLAFWAAEEIGLVGSRYYVNQLALHDPEELSRIKLSLDNDMLASPNYIRGVYDGSTVQDPHLRVGCTSIQNLFKNYFGQFGWPTAPGVFDGRSDYVAFMDHGIPSGGLFTGADGIKTAEQAQDFGGLIGVALDPCYHQDCDRVSKLYGPGLEILKQNTGALAYALEVYSTHNLTQILFE